ncbi:MAG: hypothetical protein A2161_17125 [Candidatus Schekmanbacteria bacterium RBG_13_48_7]|uniref:Uncharacterized protein n=1 Tax=Candidatus Schekmanbacteria bacterium RBG_13_48_7 TaxID=1817878 RepID=A0A1F7S2I4_9BACT|nr:MAG: hypothetical protein A2161_17125 [Candidatus Schekmanbacteria bacterium RBG_13_48_7]
MKVFLIVPPALKTQSQQPDLGMGYLATALRKNGHIVDLLQAEKDRNFERLRETLRASKPDVVGIKVYSLEIKTTRAIIEIIKNDFPSCFVVLGGPHVSVAPPEETMNFFHQADYAIQGEGEIPLPILLENLKNGKPSFEKIPGLIYRHNGKVLANETIIHRNIDDFDYPAWDLIDPRKYNDRWFFWTPEYPGAPMITNRGCPYLCTFCSQNVVTGKRVRYRSLENVFTELEMLQEKYGVKDFDLIDDNFLMKPSYVTKFCEGILERGWKIRWNCGGARLDFMDFELAKLMERAGCNIIAVGYENGNQRMLDYMKKDLDLNSIKAKSKMITDNTSIRLFGLFILGFPTETKEEILNTIRYSQELPLFAATYSTYILLPGNEEYERLKSYGEIDAVPWEKLCLDAHVYAPKGMTIRTLKYLYWKAFFGFFLRPRIMWNLMKYSWRRIPLFIDRIKRKLFWKKSLT